MGYSATTLDSNLHMADSSDDAALWNILIPERGVYHALARRAKR